MANSVAKFSVVLGADSTALTKDLGGASKAVGGFSSAVAKSLDALPKAAMNAGKAFVGMAKDFLGLKTGMEAVNVGVDFERQMSIVGAMTGATGDKLSALREEARRLGRDTEFTATQAAEAMSQLATHGFAVPDILTATKGVVQLASVLKVDIPQAAVIASDAMGGFGLHADQIQRVSDVIASMLTGASTGGADAIQDAFKYVAATAHAAGKSIEEVSAALMVLNNAGIKGSEAGSALARLMMKMAKQTPQAQEAMDKLGLSFEDANGEFKSLADITDELQKKLTGLSKPKKLELIGKIFDVRAGRAAMILASLEGGGEKIRKNQERLLAAGGTSARIAAQQLDNVWGAIKIVQSSWDGMTEAIYSSIKGPLKVNIDKFTAGVNKMRDSVNGVATSIGPAFEGANQKLGETLDKAAQLVPLVNAWAGAFAAIEKATKGLNGGGNILGAFGPGIVPYIDLMSKYKNEILAVAWTAEYLATNSGKAAEVINAKFAVAGAKIMAFLFEMKDGFTDVFNFVKDIGEWAVSGIGELFDRMLTTATAKFKALGNALEKFFKDPSKGWQYEAPAPADYKGAFGEMPKFKSTTSVEATAANAMIPGLEAKAKLLGQKFGMGWLGFIRMKQAELNASTNAAGTKFLGFDLTKFIGGGAPPRTPTAQELGQVSDKGTSAVILGSLEAAQAELKFWREEQGKSAEAQALAEAKRQSAYQAAMLKELQESNNPTRWDLIF